jgi:hypothetical protein
MASWRLVKNALLCMSLRLCGWPYLGSAGVAVVSSGSWPYACRGRRRRSGVVWLWNSEVLVSSSMPPLRHELQVVKAAEAGFEMAVLQKKISWFSRLRIQRGWRVQSVYTRGEFMDIRASPGHLCKRSRQATKGTRIGSWFGLGVG